LSYRFYNAIRSLCNLLLSCSLVAKLLAMAFPAWAFVQNQLGLAVLILCGLRLVFILIDLARGAMRWQRSIFPSIILLALVSIFGGGQSTLLVKIAAAALEIGVLGSVIYIAATGEKAGNRSFEERLMERVQLFIPISLARYLVAETLILRAAFVGLFGRSGNVPQGFGYVENSIFRVLPLIILFCSPVDIVLVHIVLRIKSPVWTTILIGTDIYALAWAYGSLVTMRLRPHEIVGKYLHVHKGIYECASIALASIRSITVLPRSRIEKKEGDADLSLRGTSKCPSSKHLGQQWA